MEIEKDILSIVEAIDIHVNKFSDDETGNTQLLTTFYDYMESFKTVMDSVSSEEMDYLSQQYSGFYRFASLLQSMAKGISDGTLEVPKDH